MVFGVMIYSSVNNRIDEIYNVLEVATLGIADTYSESLVHFTDAKEIATELLDERINVVSEAIVLLGLEADKAKIEEITQKLNVDVINIYNEDTEIIASNVDEFIGFVPSLEHPVMKFVESYERSYVEDIRVNAVDGLYYKFGYIKREDGTIIQVGVLAENIHKFTNRFEIQQLIDNIVTRDGILDALFIDSSHNITAHSFPSDEVAFVHDYGNLENLAKNVIQIENCEYHGYDVLQASAPLYYGNDYQGTLAIIWPTNMVDTEIRSIIRSGILEFLVIMTIIVSILFYAYRKNISNVKSAYYDKLTGLPNSLYLEEFLNKEIQELENKTRAVLMLNCKNFKTLNMTYGFKYGDNILIQIAENIKKSLNKDEMLFRFNADRFVLVLGDYDRKEALKDRARYLIKKFKEPLNGDSKYEYISAQVSILEIVDHEMTADRVLQDLSLAISNINTSSVDQIEFFNESMETNIKRQDIIENTIKDVIEGRDYSSIYLNYQPKIDILKNQLVGFEALARMKDKELGFVSPLEFIEIAEKKLLIYELGNYILEAACDFTNNLVKNDFENFRIAVNISLIQIMREEFLDDVRKILKAKKTDSKLLEFEITESAIVDNLEIINKKLIELKDIGITIALDDFGTGFSSFARLHSAHIDTVKIDRYFIDRLDKYDSGNLITSDIISMSHKLGLSVVAEGVESSEQLDYLKKHDCDIAQGYLISKPLTEKDALLYAKSFKT